MTHFPMSDSPVIFTLCVVVAIVLLVLLYYSCFELYTGEDIWVCLISN
jgi:hypothetical protein